MAPVGESNASVKTRNGHEKAQRGTKSKSRPELCVLTAVCAETAGRVSLWSVAIRPWLGSRCGLRSGTVPSAALRRRAEQCSHQCARNTVEKPTEPLQVVATGVNRWPDDIRAGYVTEQPARGNDDDGIDTARLLRISWLVHDLTLHSGFCFLWALCPSLSRTAPEGHNCIATVTMRSAGRAQSQVVGSARLPEPISSDGSATPSASRTRMTSPCMGGRTPPLTKVGRALTHFSNQETDEQSIGPDQSTGETQRRTSPR